MSAISDDVRRMARRLPGVTDRTLLELVNGLGVARGVAADSAELGVIGRLVAELTGRRHKAQLLIFQSLINGQLALTDLATESNRRSAVTDLALARVADHLRQVKETAAATRIAQQRLSFEVSELTVLVGEYIQVCDERFRELEDWRASIDLKLAADDFLADTVARADAAYAGVPWPYQAILMARHLASGSCGRWDALRTNETYRTRVTEAIFGVLGEVHAAPDRGVTFVAVLDDSWRRLHSADQRWLMAELLDAGLRPELALDRKPLTSIAALTMELASLPEESRPEQPARTALELNRRRAGWIDGGATRKRFVELVVAEQFDLTASAWQRLEAEN
ncbi:MAG TPA: hypothetical protein VKZ82_14845 [Nonomuraea sp.]|nr:hypothetical protein [Nonomuraea sp.]